MRIISKFKDYYDSVQIYGVDTSTTFIRKTSEPMVVEKLDILSSSFDWPRERIFRNRYRTNDSIDLYDYLLLFFCGNVYPILTYHEVLKTNEHLYTNCYYINEVDELMIKHKVEKYFKKDKYKSWFNSWNKRDEVQSIFNIPIDKNKVLELHHKIESPYFIFSSFNSSIVINPVLKDLLFFRVMDAFKTYQEVYMFISGILGGKSPKTIEVSDEVRKIKHGFNEWSFKTEPKNK